MKPEQWRVDTYHDICGLSPFNSDISRSFNIIDHDPIPKEDDQGRKRVEGFKMTFEGVIKKEWTNFVQALHGGAAAFLVDNCTSATVIAISSPTFWGLPMLSGVSNDLNVQYFHPVKVKLLISRGTRLQIKCEILRCTSTLANLRCNAINADTGQLMFSGTHLKSWKAIKNPTSTSTQNSIKAKL